MYMLLGCCAPATEMQFWPIYNCYYLLYLLLGVWTYTAVWAFSVVGGGVYSMQRVGLSTCSGFLLRQALGCTGLGVSCGSRAAEGGLSRRGPQA